MGKNFLKPLTLKNIGKKKHVKYHFQVIVKTFNGKKEKQTNIPWKGDLLSVFVSRSTNRTSMAQGFLRWVWTQGRSPHAPGIPKNV